MSCERAIRIGWAMLAVSACGVLRAAAAGTVPQAVCAAPAFDFGTQTDDSIVRHVFRVENRGDAPLSLRVGRACCGATVTVPAQAIPPGRAGEVRVDLVLRGRSGRVIKSVYVQSNDSTNSLLRLELSGRVIAIPGAAAP